MAKDKVWIYLDADPLLFEVTEGKFTKMTMFGNEAGDVSDNYSEPLSKYKERFKALVQDVEDEIALHVLGGKISRIKGVKVIISDPTTNFRYGIYPKYKCSREEGARGKLFYRLRKWALKEYGCIPAVEADDVVSHYVRKGHIGATMDKDMLRGVAGMWFDTYHTRRTFNEVSELEAQHFNYIQTLMGDPTDDIKALPNTKGDPMIPCVLPEGVKRQPYKVTEKLAIDLLEEFGWNWDGVLKAYESKGFGVTEMELTARLILLNQWHPKKGLTLFKHQLTKGVVK